MSFRPAWSTDWVPEDRGLTEKPCLKTEVLTQTEIQSFNQMNLDEQEGKTTFPVINQIIVTNILNTTEASSGHTCRSPELWLSERQKVSWAESPIFMIFSYPVTSQETILPDGQKATGKMHLQAEVNGRPHPSFLFCF